MTDKAVVHIGENSPEHVAYKLMRDIAVLKAEDDKPRDRKYVLDLYAECLHATTGGRSTSSGLRAYKTDAT